MDRSSLAVQAAGAVARASNNAAPVHTEVSVTTSKTGKSIAQVMVVLSNGNSAATASAAVANLQQQIAVEGTAFTLPHLGSVNVSTAATSAPVAKQRVDIHFPGQIESLTTRDTSALIEQSRDIVASAAISVGILEAIAATDVSVEVPQSGQVAAFV